MKRFRNWLFSASFWCFSWIMLCITLAVIAGITGNAYTVAIAPLTAIALIFFIMLPACDTQRDYPVD